MINFTVMGRPENELGVVAPYNNVFSIRNLRYQSNLVACVDNAAMFNQCTKLGVESPSFSNINRLLAQAISAVTSSTRFSSIEPTNLDMISQNLHRQYNNRPIWPTEAFMVPTFGPMVSREEKKEFPINQLTLAAYMNKNSMLTVKLDRGKFIATSNFFRGDSFSLDKYEINKTINSVQNSRRVHIIAENKSPVQVSFTVL